MVQPLKTVAVLIANPALSSILSMTLAAVPSLRVRPFETEAALRSYMRLAPTELLVTDLDAPLAASLRADPETSRGLQIIALAHSVSGETRNATRTSGIDEIILKPMSPRYLLERVLARLRRTPPVPPARRRRVREWSDFGDNVVPLFPVAAQEHPRP